MFPSWNSRKNRSLGNQTEKEALGFLGSVLVGGEESFDNGTKQDRGRSKEEVHLGTAMT